jgi:DNA-directed RNA polymerase specialized sigma24 family protein
MSAIPHVTRGELPPNDIVQETFIRAWRRLPQLTAGDRPIRPWLFKVARNLLSDADRAARARPVTVRAQPAEDVGDDTGLDQIPSGTARSRLRCAPQALLQDLHDHDAPGA